MLLVQQQYIHMYKKNSDLPISIIILALLTILSAEMPVSQNFNNFDNANQLVIGSQIKYPTLTQITKWIIQANSKELLLLKNKFNSPLPNNQCGVATSLIDKITGLMKTAVWKNSIAINKVILQNYELNQQLQSIKSLIKKQQSIKQQIALPRIKLALQSLISCLSDKYRNIAQLSLQIKTTQKSLVTNSNQLNDLKQQSSQFRSQIFQRNIQLTLINQQITRLQQQLLQLKSKKTTTQTLITQSEKLLKANTDSINHYQQQSNKLLSKSQSLSSQKQQLNKQTIALESEIIKLQGVIDSRESSYAQILSKLQKSYQQQHLIQSNIDNLVSPSTLSARIMILTQLVGEYETIGVRSYYFCYTSQSQLILKNKSYILSNFELALYLSRIYSDKVALPQTNVGDQYPLRLIDLFGYVWTQRFGFPFDQDNTIADSLYLRGDRTCQKDVWTEFSENGVINFINANSIVVDTLKQGRITLLLGPCTKLQSKKQIPAIKDTLYFKGYQLSPSIINALIITIF